MRTCKDIHRLAAESMDRETGFAERIGMRLHLALCDNCRRFMRQMDFLRAALRRYPGDGDHR